MNNTLPIEILKKIFQNLIAKSLSKKDLKTCSSVCKSWKVAAQEIFGKMSIKVNEHSLEKLSRDIVYFGQKVKSIELTKPDLFAEDLDRTVTFLAWRDIILACPNLVSIDIKVKDDTSFVQCLMDIPTERFKHIQSIEATPLTSGLHLQLNLKYCKSITSLSVVVNLLFKKLSGSDRNDMIVVCFISRFPNLTSLRLNGLFMGVAIDLIQLLEVVPQLQELFLYHISLVTCSSKTISDNSCLSVLRLTAETMDISPLIFITTRLKKLNKLKLGMYNLLMGAPQNTFGIRNNYSAEELLTDLKNYTSGISKFYIEYTYEGVTYKLGKKPKRFSCGDFDSDDDDIDYDESDYDVSNDYYDDRDYDFYTNMKYVNEVMKLVSMEDIIQFHAN